MPVDYRRAIREMEAAAEEPQSLAAAGE